jgi:hypothetical protein
MSKVALSGNASGTGTFTIASPNSNTDRTLNLPDSSGTVATAESTLTQFNASGSAPVYACRAWVNFNGTGTVAIRASGNVSSITDNGTGDYTLNFTNAMPDANYTPVVSNGDPTVADLVNLNNETSGAEVAPTTTALRITVSQTGVAYRDQKYMSVAIFR